MFLPLYALLVSLIVLPVQGHPLMNVFSVFLLMFNLWEAVLFLVLTNSILQMTLYASPVTLGVLLVMEANLINVFLVSRLVYILTF
jgi:hypothetical protein